MPDHSFDDFVHAAVEHHHLIHSRILSGAKRNPGIAQNFLRSDIAAGDFRDSNAHAWLHHSRFCGHRLELADNFHGKVSGLGAKACSLEQNADRSIFEERDPIVSREHRADWLDGRSHDEICRGPAFFGLDLSIVIQPEKKHREPGIDRFTSNLQLPVYIIEELGPLEDLRRTTQ